MAIGSSIGVIKHGLHGVHGVGQLPLSDRMERLSDTGFSKLAGGKTFSTGHKGDWLHSSISEWMNAGAAEMNLFPFHPRNVAQTIRIHGAQEGSKLISAEASKAYSALSQKYSPSLFHNTGRFAKVASGRLMKAGIDTFEQTPFGIFNVAPSVSRSASGFEVSGGNILSRGAMKAGLALGERGRLGTIAGRDMGLLGKGLFRGAGALTRDVARGINLPTATLALGLLTAPTSSPTSLLGNVIAGPGGILDIAGFNFGSAVGSTIGGMVAGPLGALVGFIGGGLSGSELMGNISKGLDQLSAFGNRYGQMKFGSGTFQHNEVTLSQRQAALQAIGDSQMNLRSALGGEANFLHLR